MQKISGEKGMANHILKELPELVEAQVISSETAEKISAYYQHKKTGSENRLLLAFGILGALISGLGIILIVAHNWDELSRQTKTLLAFVPLVLGQLACAYVLFRDPENRNLKEISATFLFLAIGATIALISQIYHIPGNLTNFLLTWMLLGFPLIYLMRSEVAALLYVAGSTYFVMQSGPAYIYKNAYYFWPMLAAALPFYRQLLRQNPAGNAVSWLNWLLPISVIIGLATIMRSHQEFMVIGYLSLFGIFYQLGTSRFFRHEKQPANGFFLLGMLGTLAVLLFLSFEGFWENLATEKYAFPQPFTSIEFILALGFTALAAVLLFRKFRKTGLNQLTLMEAVFLFIPLAFLGGYFAPLASQIFINLLILLLGILTIRSGARQNHLGILNVGLLIIATLVSCRFFDTNLSFVARGILFLLVGAGFFAANYYMLKNRKTA
ncbi:MAG TPA: DUF2157 domain-containing protein [Adhaeribacter sp.]|nr:DUF2157 domain-containing protein [Adhaeribacter sp.]